MPTLAPGPTESREDPLLAHWPPMGEAGGGQTRAAQTASGADLGRRPAARASAATFQTGATLLEMMVVLAIIGIVAGAAGLGFNPNSSDRILRREAQRLAWLMPVAQAQARATGKPLLWQYDELGYRFAPRKGRQPVAGPLASVFEASGDPALRARLWEGREPPTVRVVPAREVVITGEWMPEPLRIELGDGWHTVSVVRDAAGRYGVEP